MRKQLIILIAVLLAVFAAIGCTSTDTQDQPTENQTPVDQPTTTDNMSTDTEDNMQNNSMDEEEDMMENDSSMNDTMEEENMMENDSMDEEDMVDNETMEEGETTVTITEDGFEPFDAQITVGDTITWMNDDSIAHTIVDDEGVFDSGGIEPGESYSYTFDEAGTYTYTSVEDETFEAMITVVTSDDGNMSENSGDVVVVPVD